MKTILPLMALLLITSSSCFADSAANSINMIRGPLKPSNLSRTAFSVMPVPLTISTSGNIASNIQCPILFNVQVLDRPRAVISSYGSNTPVAVNTSPLTNSYTTTDFQTVTTPSRPAYYTCYYLATFYLVGENTTFMDSLGSSLGSRQIPVNCPAEFGSDATCRLGLPADAFGPSSAIANNTGICVDDSAIQNLFNGITNCSKTEFNYPGYTPHSYWGLLAEKRGDAIARLTYTAAGGANPPSTTIPRCPPNGTPLQIYVPLDAQQITITYDFTYYQPTTGRLWYGPSYNVQYTSLAAVQCSGWGDYNSRYSEFSLKGNATIVLVPGAVNKIIVTPQSAIDISSLNWGTNCRQSIPQSNYSENGVTTIPGVGGTCLRGNSASHNFFNPTTGPTGYPLPTRNVNIVNTP